MKRPQDDPRDSDIDTVHLVTSLVIHRDIGDDDDMVRCLVMKTVTMHGGNVPDLWWLSGLITITRTHLHSVSVRPSHNITSYKTAQCSHVTPSQENWWLGKNLQSFWKHFSLLIVFRNCKDWSPTMIKDWGCENSLSPYFSLLINLERVQGNLIQCNYMMGGIKMKNAHGTWLACPNICHHAIWWRQDTRWIITGLRMRSRKYDKWGLVEIVALHCCLQFGLHFSNNYPHYPDHYKPITPLGFSHIFIVS